MNGEVVILGVDPGLRITGYGAVVCTPARTQALDYGHIKTDSRVAIEARLHTIYWGIRAAIRRFNAQELAIELPFVAVNIRSAFAIGEARAAAGPSRSRMRRRVGLAKARKWSGSSRFGFWRNIKVAL